MRLRGNETAGNANGTDTLPGSVPSFVGGCAL
jgi:hypothetical protein